MLLSPLMRIISAILLGVVLLPGCGSEPAPPTESQVEQAIEVQRERSHREQTEAANALQK